MERPILLSFWLRETLHDSGRQSCRCFKASLIQSLPHASPLLIMVEMPQLPQIFSLLDIAKRQCALDWPPKSAAARCLPFTYILILSALFNSASPRARQIAFLVSCRKARGSRYTSAYELPRFPEHLNAKAFTSAAEAFLRAFSLALLTGNEAAAAAWPEGCLSFTLPPISLLAR